MTHLSDAAFTPAAGCAATCTPSNARMGLPRPPCQCRLKGVGQHERKSIPSTKNTPVRHHTQQRRIECAASSSQRPSRGSAARLPGPRNASAAEGGIPRGTQVLLPKRTETARRKERVPLVGSTCALPARSSLPPARTVLCPSSWSGALDVSPSPLLFVVGARLQRKFQPPQENPRPVLAKYTALLLPCRGGQASSPALRLCPRLNFTGRHAASSLWDWGFAR